MPRSFVLPCCVLAVASIAGCGTTPDDYRALTDAYAKSAAVSTLEFECSQGCKGRYTDPRDRPKLRMPTNGWDFARGMIGDIKDVALGVAPYAAVGIVAAKSIANSGHNTTTADDHSVIDRHDATAAPVIVTQPTPVIVTQPTPVIVHPEIITVPTP